MEMSGRVLAALIEAGVVVVEELTAPEWWA